ncbi:glutathione S-transferase family protein [Flexivirga sp. B27]
MITLYDDETSADCYRVRVLLDVLGLDFRSIALEEYDAGPDAPRPSVVLVDPACSPPAVVHDSGAALTYLCATYDESRRLWGGGQPAKLAQVLDWLALSSSLSATAGAARRQQSFGDRLDDVDGAQAEAHRLLRFMDRHLWFGEQQGDDFLVGEFSVADIACFGDAVLCEEGGISQQDYPAVRRWFDRVKRAPGVPLMSGIFPAPQERPA